MSSRILTITRLLLNSLVKTYQDLMGNADAKLRQSYGLIKKPLVYTSMTSEHTMALNSQYRQMSR